MDAVEVALTDLVRNEAPRVLSILAGRFRDLDLADDSVQDALLDAHRTWDRDGIPSNPAGWLMLAARRRAIDRVRAAKRQDEHWRAAAPELIGQNEDSDAGASNMIDDTNHSDADDIAGGDERLRLLLLCCHPALDEQSQVALTLRLVGGLTTTEIAAAFVVSEPTIAQRIVRAKRKIRTAAIPMSMPAELGERLDALLGVIYLIFNEGYLSPSADEGVVRADLVDDAVRLTRLVAALVPDHPEPLGLLSLELFQRSRSATRVDDVGGLVLLADQDRSRWNLDDIGEANEHLVAAMTMMRPGPYQLQAMIAGEHANARVASDTDWPRIAALYAQLDAMSGSPVVRLNRAVAVAEADGPLAGLAMLDDVDGLDDYHLYWSTLGELHRRAGHAEEASAAMAHALTMNLSEPERRLVERRLATLT